VSESRQIVGYLRLIEIDPRAESQFVSAAGASVKWSMARVASDAADRIEWLERSLASPVTITQESIDRIVAEVMNRIQKAETP
jgi:hypothetical protein